MARVIAWGGGAGWDEQKVQLDQDAQDVDCCGIWVTKSSASEWKWILKGYPLYMLFAFVECMLCAFAINLVISFSCHGFYIIMVFFAHCFLCDCAKREKDYQNQKGRDCLRCIMQNIKFLNLISAGLYLVGNIFMFFVLVSIPARYKSPADWEPSRRLQSMRPILIGITNIAVHGSCDECMSIKECCQVWGKCFDDVEETSTDAATAWEQSQGGGAEEASDLEKCIVDPKYCWSGPVLELGQGPLDWVKLGIHASGGPCWKASRAPNHWGWAIYHIFMNVFLALWQLRLALAAHRLHRVLKTGKDITWSKGEWDRLHAPSAPGDAAPAPAAAASSAAPSTIAVVPAKLVGATSSEDDVEVELQEVKAAVSEIQGLLEKEMKAEFSHRIHAGNNV